MSEEEETPGPEIIDPAALKDAHVLSFGDQQLSVQLTEEEWTEHAEGMATGAIEIAMIEAAEKSRRSSWTAAHKTREGAQFDLVEIVKARAEDRQVEVKVFGFLDGSQRVTVRMDNLEVLDRRALTVDELDKLSQQPLPYTEPDDEPAESPEPLPTGAHDLVKYIRDGKADDRLDALKADTRKNVGKALKARVDVLAALELPPEAGESEPDDPKPAKRL